MDNEMIIELATQCHDALASPDMTANKIMAALAQLDTSNAYGDFEANNIGFLAQILHEKLCDRNTPVSDLMAIARVLIPGSKILRFAENALIDPKKEYVNFITEKMSLEKLKELAKEDNAVFTILIPFALTLTVGNFKDYIKERFLPAEAIIDPDNYVINDISYKVVGHIPGDQNNCGSVYIQASVDVDDSLFEDDLDQLDMIEKLLVLTKRFKSQMSDEEVDEWNRISRNTAASRLILESEANNEIIPE